jgi:hypothetical protein
LIIDFADNRELHVFQLDSPGAGWKNLKITGEMPQVTAEPSRFVFFPPDGNFYYRPLKNGGTTLHRLTPPKENAIEYTWVADTVSLNQSMPDCDAALMTGAWYSFLFYVPANQCLAWIVGYDKPVYIFKPPLVSKPTPKDAKTEEKPKK